MTTRPTQVPISAVELASAMARYWEMRDDSLSTSPLIGRGVFIKKQACDGAQRGLQQGLEIDVEIGETLYVTTPAEFRRWLRANNNASQEIWLIQYKKATKKPSIALLEAQDEAMCFGWVDSTMKSMDAERYATRFTPRRPNSNWTEGNKERARRLIAERRMTAAGKAALPPEMQEP